MTHLCAIVDTINTIIFRVSKMCDEITQLHKVLIQILTKWISSSTFFLFFIFYLFHKLPSIVFLRKRCSENIQQIVISISLQSNLTEITLRLGYSPVNQLHIFRTPVLKNTSGGQLLNLVGLIFNSVKALLINLGKFNCYHVSPCGN